MRRWLQFIFLLLAVSAFAYAPERRGFLPGTHQLTVTALHPSGLFTTNKTSSFTNNIGSLTITNISDGAGNLTQRIWRKANGTTNLIQTLAWDARGRLHKVTERDSTQSGRDFSIVYDALGRRLRTTEIVVTNNVALTNSPNVVSHYFDPMVEFLEVGVNENGKTTWKLIGPDFDGRYGGQNGTGGFEATASGFTFSPVVSDSFGNVLAVYEQSGLIWNGSRHAAYGGVPGYRPQAVGSSSGSLANKYSWRNRAADTIGFVWMGGNWLDPQSGRFLSFDPLGHDASDNGYAFCLGNPVGYNWDPDGRSLYATANFAYNGGLAGYGLRALGDAFNQAAVTESTYLNWQMLNNGSAFNMLADAVSPSAYVNSFNTLQTRAENVMVQEYLNGSGNTWAALNGVSSIVGDSVGYNQIMAGGFGVDRQTGTLLSTSDRWSQGLMGGSQMILTGTALGATYNPAATFLPQSVPPVIPRAGPLPPGEAPYQLTLFPDVPYNRVAQYGRTPTPAQRASVPSGMEFDHNPTLVQHYYEGAGNGTLPGFNLTQTERILYGASLDAGSAATPAAQRAQGAAAAQYSRQQQIQSGLR